MSLLPDWLTGYDAANAAAAARAEAKRQELDAAAVVAGKITQDEYLRRAAVGYGADPTAQRAEIDDTFKTSVKDNAKAMSSAVADTLSFSVWQILSAIPPLVWGLAALGLFVYVGGPLWLKKKMAP